MSKVQRPVPHLALNEDGVYQDAEMRRIHLEKRLEFVQMASRALEGDAVSREEIIKWMAEEPDPRAALDQLVSECKEALGLKVI